MHNLSMDANHVCQTHLGHLEFIALLRLNVFVVIVELNVVFIFLHRDINIPFQVNDIKLFKWFIAYIKKEWFLQFEIIYLYVH